jgi:dipeptidyl aminopeptidase/acylaminoacyl peptidase
MARWRFSAIAIRAMVSRRRATRSGSKSGCRAFHGATDHPGWFALGQGGPPEADPESFGRFSPHGQLSNWRTPTLVVHGEKDYRVPISEALLLFEALQRRGVPSELLVFPDENHWIQRPRNTRRWYEVCLGFLARHLAPAR